MFVAILVLSLLEQSVSPRCTTIELGVVAGKSAPRRRKP